MIKSKKWKSIEFSVLFIISIILIGVSLKNIIEIKHQLNEKLISYNCEIWKDTTLIYSHDIKLASGAEYGIRTKNLTCDDVDTPKANQDVIIIYKGTMLLSLTQNQKELLSYDILVEDSENSSLTIYIMTIILLLITIGNGYKLRKTLQK